MEHYDKEKEKGLVAIKAGEWQKALGIFQRATDLHPNDSWGWKYKTIVMLALAKYSDSLHAAAKAIEIDPACPQMHIAIAESHAGLGSQSAEKEDWILAMYHYSEALKHRTDVGEWESNLAVAFLRLGRHNEAFHHAKLGVDLLPQRAETHNTLGTVLQECMQLDSAAECYTKALSLNPEHKYALSNLGTLRHQLGFLDEAEYCYRKHLDRYPRDVRTQVNLAGTLLIQGLANEGWQFYEARLGETSHIIRVPSSLNRWKGTGERCKTLVLVHEQGYGDTFQFLRYAQLIRQFTHEVIFQGPEKLHKLALQSGLVDGCASESHEWDDCIKKSKIRWEALLSLPMRLGATPTDPLCTKPYLRADPKRISHWKSKLKGSEPLIGLHWQGNPQHEVTISKGRSFNLKTLEEIFSIDNIRFVSLQKGPGSEELENFAFAYRFSSSQKLINDTWDFAETAAILEACDLIITSDSGLAHLAAGLGRPTWILLMHIPEWRWGLSGDKTPWYPSAKLWRQSSPGDWKGVLRSLVPALKSWKDSYNG